MLGELLDSVDPAIRLSTWPMVSYSMRSSLRATTNGQAYMVGTGGGGDSHIHFDDQVNRGGAENA